MKKVALTALALTATSLLTIPSTSAGILGDGWQAPYMLFSKYQSSDTGVNGNGWGGYRIPALAHTTQDTLVAMVDKRFVATGGNTDIVDGSGNVNKVWFSYKVSHDGGRTWSEEKTLRPPTFNEANNHKSAKNYISDPQLVHNSDTGTTFAFGYQSNTKLRNNNPNSFDVFMFTSTDGGINWDEGQSIKDRIVNLDLGTGFYKFLQGPGNGMYYTWYNLRTYPKVWP